MLMSDVEEGLSVLTVEYTGAGAAVFSVALPDVEGAAVGFAFVFARDCSSPLRNFRHVSEALAGSAALFVTAGLTPNDLPVSMSSCPVIGNPFRIWYRLSAAAR